MNILPGLISFFCGLVAFAAINSFFIGFRKRSEKTYLLFGALCLCAISFAVQSLYMYHASNVTDYVSAVKIRLFSLSLAICFFVWFIAFYTKIVKKRFLITLTVVLVVIPFLSSLFPVPIRFSIVNSLHSIVMPWGERVSIIDAVPGLYVWVFHPMVLCFFGYTFYAAGKIYHQGFRKKSLFLSICLSIFILTIVHDYIVIAFHFNNIQIMEYGFLSMILVLSFQLSEDVIQAGNIRQALVESESRFRAIFNHSFQFTGLLDTEGIVLAANRLTFNSQSLEEMMIGKPFWDAPWWENSSLSSDMIKTAIADVRTGRTLRYDVSLQSEEGTTQVFDLSLTPVRNEKGEIAYILPEARDITEMRQAKLDRLRLAAIVEQSPYSIVVTSPDSIISYVNRAFEETTGYTGKEVVGDKPFALKDNQYNPRLYETIMEKINSGGVWNGRITNRKKNGETFIEDIIICPLRSNDGGIIEYVAIGRDITDHIKLQEQLIQSQKMEALGTLAGGLAHDLNNYIGGIIGSNDLMGEIIRENEIPEKDELLQFHDIVERGAKHALSLGNQLMTLSRKEKSRVEPIDLNLAVNNALKLCISGFPKCIEIKFNRTAGPMMVLADPIQLEQVIINLCVNASHAMTLMRGEKDKQGGLLSILIDTEKADRDFCTLHPKAKEGSVYHALKVMDTGVGMDNETKSRIFEPFFTTKEKGEGTGLGLALAYSIVEHHGGFVSVYSEKNVGTTFSLHFLENQVFTESKEEEKERNDQKSYSWSGIVLVIDDEEVMRQTVKAMLERAGFMVISGSNGYEGIRLFNIYKDQIKFLLLDMSMPKMSGIDVFKEIEKIIPGIKVIFMSAFSQDSKTLKMPDTGNCEFIRKPFGYVQLMKKIEAFIEE